jgi:mRNA interferase MazF
MSEKSEINLLATAIAMADQIRVLSKTRLLSLRRTISDEVMKKLDRALLIALDLPGLDS